MLRLKPIYALAVLFMLIFLSCKKDKVAPALLTTSVHEISYTSAKAGGEILDNGSSPVTLHGICWGTSPKPSVTGNKTYDNNSSKTFELTMEGLLPGTEYYVRAFATNIEGVGYGTERKFKTNSLEPATLNTTVATSVTFTTAQSGGNISAGGGSIITSRGVCWGTAENPTVEDNKTVDGNGTGIFTSNITGLSPNTVYYARAYAENTSGISYGNQVTFITEAVRIPAVSTAQASEITNVSAVSGGDVTDNGGGAISKRGVCYGTSQNPDITGSKTSDGTGTGVFVSHLANLYAVTVYYARAYATNSAGTGYGEQVTFVTSNAGLPVIITKEISGLTSTTAETGGQITSNGGAPVIANGICWNTTGSPGLEDNFTSDATGMAEFNSTITGMEDGTVYYARAYATNGTGTSYGNQVTFITPVTDIEGNIYRTVKIGDQVWMAVNLKTTRFSDDQEITNVTGSAEWLALTSPAYCLFDNDPASKDAYGALYNWYAVNTGRLCPAGWHAPSDQDFNDLESSLGIPADEIYLWGYRGTDQGTQMKSTSSWDGNGNGTNSSGFDAKAAGYRQWTTGAFWGIGTFTYFWTSTDDAANGHPEAGWYRRLDNLDTRIYKAATDKDSGKYVRCLKD